MKRKPDKMIRKQNETLADFISRVRDVLRKSRATVSGMARGLASICPRLNMECLQKIADAAVERIKTSTANTLQSFAALSEQNVKAEANYRRFQSENNITRDARQPDILKTLLILQCGFLAEGLLGTALFMDGGQYDLRSSLAIAFAIAGINTLTACAAGFFPGRYIAYRIDAEKPLLRDKAIRLLAWFGMLVMLSGLAVLHLSAARSRILGRHTDLFDFSTVSFMETWNDFFATGIATVGIVTAIIAFFKGRNNFSDPIVGYSQIARDVELHCKQAAENLYHDAIAHIEGMKEYACETIENQIDEAQDNQLKYHDERNQIADRISDHNDLVDHMVDVLRGMQTQEREAEAFIRQSVVPTAPSDFSDFEALKLQPLAEDQDAEEDINDHVPDDLLAALEQAFQDAIAQIEEAYNAFLMPVTPYTPNSINSTNQEVLS